MELPKKPFKKRFVYLDHGAATPLDPAVFFEMKPWLTTCFGNPSALYGFGVQAKKHVEYCRAAVSKVLESQPDTIFFTSGGTESNNAAILGVARAHKANGKHIITTRIEHSAVLEPISQLEKEGFEISYLSVDNVGNIDIEEFKRKLRKDTILVSIMYINNEIGVINPIAEIGKEILKWRKQNETSYPYFHTDACQAVSTQDLHVEKLHVDLLSLNGSKIYGPKGTGVLYKRRGVEISPLLYGGGQEAGARGGTENVAGIAGMAKALVMAELDKAEYDSVRIIRNYFWNCIKKSIPDVTLNGPDVEDNTRAPQNLNVSFLEVDAETLLLYLDEYGIMCSKGSACETDKAGSHVLLAIGLDEEHMRGAIRFTLGKNTSKRDIEYVMKYLPALVQVLRNNKT